jgi:DNA polymerase epsilon subunit 1
MLRLLGGLSVKISWRIIADCYSANAGFDTFDEQDYDRRQDGFVDASDFIVDIREYDVPYHVRVAIDKGK